MSELPGLQEVAYLLSKAQSASEVDQIWMLAGLKENMTVIIALEEYKRANIPTAVKKYAKGKDSVLVPYFSGGEVYFLNSAILLSYFERGRADFKIDYSLMFDTNMASYVDALMRGRPLKSMHNRVISFVDDILSDDLNFDYFYYMAENVKEVKNIHQCPTASPLAFWRTLSKAFRRNLVSLQLFRSIDCAEYRRSSNPKPRFTHWEAARRAITFSHSYYASKEGRERALSFVLMQRVILLQVIGIVKIQLSSNKSAKYKISEFFDYVNDVVGVYLDREAIVAHKYFVEPRLIKMLEKIKRGPKIPRRLLKKLDNIAWDMAAPRYMETLIMSQGEGDFFIPMFISFDGGLKQLMNAYQVKGVVFDNRRGGLIPLPLINTEEYFEAHGCADALLKIGEQKKARSDKLPPNRHDLHQLIKREYAALRKLLL
ncbi:MULTISPECIES: hypothetical protein [unclassified Pseudomonas]|uniref:hypothetical protein n=1 Tax=unclassified Pseudomonas TaxID=196821 RepID=UPI000F56AEFD|nr:MULTISPECIES: hypothetical protein [unclassified Pseudomonas]AZF48250.1 hypothetical protein C4J86_3017 [Pseudomonas sp. R2-7-07]AZF58758.1 hypothetical protein C4J84_2883 [Pseudomonas sp. R11-23-07]